MNKLFFPCFHTAQKTDSLDDSPKRCSSASTHLITSLALGILGAAAAAYGAYFYMHCSLHLTEMAAGAAFGLTTFISYVILRLALGERTGAPKPPATIKRGQGTWQIPQTKTEKPKTDPLVPKPLITSVKKDLIDSKKNENVDGNTLDETVEDVEDSEDSTASWGEEINGHDPIKLFEEQIGNLSYLPPEPTKYLEPKDWPFLRQYKSEVKKPELNQNLGRQLQRMALQKQEMTSLKTILNQEPFCVHHLDWALEFFETRLNECNELLTSNNMAPFEATDYPLVSTLKKIKDTWAKLIGTTVQYYDLQENKVTHLTTLVKQLPKAESDFYTSFPVITTCLKELVQSIERTPLTEKCKETSLTTLSDCCFDSLGQKLELKTAQGIVDSHVANYLAEVDKAFLQFFQLSPENPEFVFKTSQEYVEFTHIIRNDLKSLNEKTTLWLQTHKVENSQPLDIEDQLDNLTVVVDGLYDYWTYLEEIVKTETSIKTILKLLKSIADVLPRTDDEIYKIYPLMLASIQHACLPLCNQEKQFFSSFKLTPKEISAINRALAKLHKNGYQVPSMVLSEEDPEDIKEREELEKIKTLTLNVIEIYGQSTPQETYDFLRAETSDNPEYKQAVLLNLSKENAEIYNNLVEFIVN